jgi:hypothetical protein
MSGQGKAENLNYKKEEMLSGTLHGYDGTVLIKTVLNNRTQQSVLSNQ